jgi:hypothetical protein
VRTLSVDGEARATATERFVAEWRDPDSWVRREARARLAGGLWSAPVVEQALDNAFVGRQSGFSRIPLGDWFERSHQRALRTLVILPGNIIGPALHAAYQVAVTGATAILKASSTERVLAEIIERQWQAIGAPLAGTLEARYWLGGDVAHEAAAIAQVENVIVFGTDETVDDVRDRTPAERQFTGYGTKYSMGLVMPDAELREAADAAALDICLFDQAGCKSPQTIYVAGDPSRALRFAQALGDSMRTVGARLPRARPSSDEAAAANDVLRRSHVTALETPSHGLSPVLAGPDNGGCPDFLIVVEPQGPPKTYAFGRIAVIMPLAGGMRPVLSTAIEQLGMAGTFDAWAEVAPLLFEDVEWEGLVTVNLGNMQRIMAQPFAYDFLRHNGDVA